MRHLPHYYHLTPLQRQNLSFRVTIRSKDGRLQTKDIGWKQKISLEDIANEDTGAPVVIYTNTSEEEDSSILTDCAKFENDGRNALAERIRREGKETESSFTMQIVARVDNHRDKILCVLKTDESGMVSACPALALGGNEWYSIVDTLDQGNIDYSIELMLCQEDEDQENSSTSRIENAYDKICEEKRRLLTSSAIDEANAFTNQTHVEIVSASGFTQSNILFSLPFGSSIILKYRLVNSEAGDRREDEQVVLEGSTNKAQSYDIFSTSIKFLSQFSAVTICIGLVIILHLPGKDIGSDFSPTVLLSIIPLGLLCQFIVYGHTKTHHINHQFSFLFRKCSVGNDHPATISHHTSTLDMGVYFHHNFGLISLAGSASIPLPSEAGNYEFNVPTDKLLACKDMNYRLCRMQSYFLGTCISNVENINSRHLNTTGLVTSSTGTITIRVNVMKNYFNGEHSIHQYESESPRHRLKVKETVEEVLARVRRNKRIRMSRLLATLPASSTHSTERNIARRRSRRSHRSVESKDGDADVVADNREEIKRSDQTTNDALQNVSKSSLQS